MPAITEKNLIIIIRIMYLMRHLCISILQHPAPGCQFPIPFETGYKMMRAQEKNCEISEAHQRTLRLSSSQSFQTLKSNFICATCSAVGLWAFGRRSVFPLASRSSVFRSICFNVGVSFFRSVVFRATLNAFTMVSV